MAVAVAVAVGDASGGFTGRSSRDSSGGGVSVSEVVVSSAFVLGCVRSIGGVGEAIGGEGVLGE